MKFINLVLILLSYCLLNTSTQDENLGSNLSVDSTVSSDEETKAFIVNYINALNDENWEKEIIPFLRDTAFVAQHRIFRNSFRALNFQIKHINTDGPKGMIWGTVNAIYSKPYSGWAMADIKASNQELEWDEVWSFTMENGRFGGDFEMLKNHLQLIEGMGVQIESAINAASTFEEAKEQVAIVAVLDNETACYYNNDYACWKENWIEERYAVMTWNKRDGSYASQVGWTAIDSLVKKTLERAPNKLRSQVDRKNLQFKFYSPTVAYAIWEQHNYLDENTYRASQETRLLEKVAGQWKIASVNAFWDYTKEHQK